MAADADRLRAIQEDLNAVLEERVTDLLAHMKAIQEVTAQIAATEVEIRRQEALKEHLEGELEPLTSEADDLRAENAELQGKVDKLQENVSKMRKLREELMGNLSGLSKGLATGE